MHLRLTPLRPGVPGHMSDPAAEVGDGLAVGRTCRLGAAPVPLHRPRQTGRRVRGTLGSEPSPARSGSQLVKTRRGVARGTASPGSPYLKLTAIKNLPVSASTNTISSPCFFGGVCPGGTETAKGRSNSWIP